MPNNRAPLLLHSLLACLTGLALASAQAQEAATETAARSAAPGTVQQKAPRFCAAPVYPKESLRAGHTGTTRVSFLIDVDGTVLETRILKSSGDPLLDEAAITALRKCQFSPATQNGKPVQASQPVEYVWSLR